MVTVAGRVAHAQPASAATAPLVDAADASPGTISATPSTSAEPAAWILSTLPGVQSALLPVLRRAARTAPARFRVIVLPGSGCAGLAGIADRYFAGLLHAEILVLHKPGIDPYAGPAPASCIPAFVQADSLSLWRDHARAALQAEEEARSARRNTPLPTLLVGISEGAELLPALAPEVPTLAGLVLLSSSGLDPLKAGTLQAQRLGALGAWQALAQAQASALPDETLRQGRSLRYWRDLWQWPLAQPLLASPWPLLQVWGEADALVPQAAYEEFAVRAQGRAAPFCARRLAGADHGLQKPGHDGVQLLWAWLEQWARAPQAGLCGS